MKVFDQVAGMQEVEYSSGGLVKVSEIIFALESLILGLEYNSHGWRVRLPWSLETHLVIEVKTSSDPL